MVKTMLGPRGMSKMLIHGLITSVTSDTAKFLGEAPISNPAGKILVDLSKRQYEQFWDGTTSTIVLTGELLKQAKKLLDMGINPSTIASGFRIAGDKAEEVLNHLTIPIRKKDTLLKVAESSVNPRVRELSLSNLLVEAVLQVAGKDMTSG